MRGAVIALCCGLLILGPARDAFGAEDGAVKTEEPPLAYIAVAGALGNGEQALTAALMKRLGAIGVNVTSALEANAYSVEGVVRVTVARGGRQSVRINWTVFAPDGSTLGGVSQTRMVRKGSLDRKWGAAADAAARAAANPIAKLLTH
jgi:hypothetical protein